MDINRILVEIGKLYLENQQLHEVVETLNQQTIDHAKTHGSRKPKTDLVQPETEPDGTM